MTLRLALAATLSAASLAFAPLPAHAQVFTVLDNLAAPGIGVTVITGTNLYGQAIRTGELVGNLLSITLPLATTGRSSRVSLTVRTYNTTSFGTILTTLVPQTITSNTFVDTTFVPATTFALTPDTPYWIVADVNEFSQVAWSFPRATTVATGNGSFPTNPNNANSSDGGVSFDQVYTLNDGAQSIRVLAVAVPEAGTLALLLPALGVGSIRLRRRL